MKNIKLLLAVAMVFAALSFSFNATAQTMVPVRLQSGSNYSSGWETTKWYLTLHNELTNEDTYFETHDNDIDYYGYHYLGEIEVGTYTVTASYSRSDVYENSFDYNINNGDWYLVHMYSNVDKQLATGVSVVYNSVNIDSGFFMSIFVN